MVRGRLEPVIRVDGELREASVLRFWKIEQSNKGKKEAKEPSARVSTRRRLL